MLQTDIKTKSNNGIQRLQRLPNTYLITEYSNIWSQP